jgi:hypothetical protein
VRGQWSNQSTDVLGLYQQHKIQRAFQKHSAVTSEQSVYKPCSNCRNHQVIIAVARLNEQSTKRLREIVGILFPVRYRYSDKFAKTAVFSAIVRRLI